MADPITIIATAASALSAGAGIISATKKAPQPKVFAQPTATPRSNAAISDALARRRGSAANQFTGPGGAESSTTAKKSFMGT